MIYKTTIVIWSKHKPELDESSLIDLIAATVTGEASLCAPKCVPVYFPTADPDWDGTEFFNRSDDASTVDKVDELEEVPVPTIDQWKAVLAAAEAHGIDLTKPLAEVFDAIRKKPS